MGDMSILTHPPPASRANIHRRISNLHPSSKTLLYRTKETSRTLPRGGLRGMELAESRSVFRCGTLVKIFVPNGILSTVSVLQGQSEKLAFQLASASTKPLI